MAEPETPEAPEGASSAAEGAAQPTTQFAVRGQYVKDLSFENPRAPASLGSALNPRMNVNVNVQARAAADQHYEVALHITAEAKTDEGVAFIIDLTYAGLFQIAGLPQEQLQPALLIECPRFLFPFARRVIADATRDGGFAPLMLEPINFAALYQNELQRQAQGQKAAAAAQPAAES